MQEKKKAMEKLGEAQYSYKLAKESKETAEKKLKENINVNTER